MGFFDIFKPKNPAAQLESDAKKMSNEIIKYYQRANQYLPVFEYVYPFVVDRLKLRINEIDASYYSKVYSNLRYNKIISFSDLILTNLYISVIPPQAVSYYEYESDLFFRNFIGNYLTNKGIPRRYSSGDNTSETYNFIKKFWEPGFMIHGYNPRSYFSNISAFDLEDSLNRNF